MTSEIYHVYPTHDLKPHQIEGMECHCHPELLPEDNGIIVVHNSFDGREIDEGDTHPIMEIPQ